MSVFDYFEEVIKKTRDRSYVAVRNTAKQLGSEIQHEFNLAIMKFYRAYKPVMGRTASMYQFSAGVGGKRVYHLYVGQANYYAGINVDPANYEGNPYAKGHGWKNVTPSFIFDLSYLRGIHGFTEDMVAGHNETLDITGKSEWKLGKRKRIPGKSESPDSIFEAAFESKFTEAYCNSVYYKYMGL